MRIFSGIQPTGRKHLGNFLGAIRGYVEGQDRGEAVYCIVDLHALTVGPDPADLRRSLYDTTALLLAAGLDPARCILFRQSDVKEHTELCWLLATVASYGELSRMTQFKEKSAQHRRFVSSGLFLYPVLQAADILAYDTDEVPVGEDQKQHIELTREIAQRFNARFGETLVVPSHRIPPVGARILDLQAPGKRMSTTASTEQGAVYILDSPEAIERKFRTAVTDSGTEIVRRRDKPGVSNLIEILSVARGLDPEAIERDFAGAGYGALKQAVADAVVGFLAPIRERYERIRPDEDGLEATLSDGAGKARAVASRTLVRVRSAMGIGTRST
jgi:tryptophanyl-tRNA synthetase